MRYLHIRYNDWLSLKKWGQSVKVQNLPYPFLRGQPLKAWLLSTRLFCFNGELYGLFWSDNLEKSDQKSILSWRCHKFKRKRRYDKWNLAFFRLECERWQQLLRRFFKTLIVCQSLFVKSNTLCWNFKPYCFYFFRNLRFEIGGAAYLRMRLIHGHLR